MNRNNRCCDLGAKLSILVNRLQKYFSKKTKEVSGNVKEEKIDFSTVGYGGFYLCGAVFAGTDWSR